MTRVIWEPLFLSACLSALGTESLWAGEATPNFQHPGQLPWPHPSLAPSCLSPSGGPAGRLKQRGHLDLPIKGLPTGRLKGRATGVLRVELRTSSCLQTQDRVPLEVSNKLISSQRKLFSHSYPLPPWVL